MEQKDLAQPLEVNFEVLEEEDSEAEWEEDAFDFLDEALDPYDDWPGMLARESERHWHYVLCRDQNAQNAHNIGDDDA